MTSYTTWQKMAKSLGTPTEPGSTPRNYKRFKDRNWQEIRFDFGSVLFDFDEWARIL